jgi:hypothetical protein
LRQPFLNIDAYDFESLNYFIYTINYIDGISRTCRSTFYIPSHGVMNEAAVIFATGWLHVEKSMRMIIGLPSLYV